MKYSGIKTNESLRFIKCPVCGNDEFSHEAEFCRVCGSAIYNYCQDQYDESGYRISNGCGRPNPGNARYCEYCGNPTLLFKYLSQWEEEKEHIEKYGNLDKNDNSSVDNRQKNEVSAASSHNEIIDETNPIYSFEQTTSTNNEDLSHTFDEFWDDDEEE